VTTDTDALVATVRDALPDLGGHEPNCPCSVGRSHAALDALAAELERVKAERDAHEEARTALNNIAAEHIGKEQALQARLDKALSERDQLEKWLRFYSADNVDVDYMLTNFRKEHLL